MTIIMPDFGKEDFYEEIEAEAELVREFLEGDYDGLNGLLLVSPGAGGRPADLHGGGSPLLQPYLSGYGTPGHLCGQPGCCGFPGKHMY